MTYSHNGSWLATKSNDGSLKVWDVATHKELQSLPAVDDNFVHASVSFSPDDRWLVMGLPKSARVWETKTWQLKRELPNGLKVWSVAFSSDGTLLATASYASRMAIVYDTSTWNEISKIELAGQVSSVAFIPNSRWLVTTAPDGTKIWEVTKPQQPLAEIGAAGDHRIPLVLSPDGHWLADKSKSLWRITLDSNKNLKLTEFVREGRPLWAKNDYGWPKAFSPDGRYLVTVGDYVRVWDVASGEETTRLEEPVSSLTFSENGWHLVTGHRDGTVKEWVADAKEAIRLQHGGKVEVKTVAYSPDGQRLATGSSDRRARIFQATGWKEVTSIEHETEVSSVAFSPNSSWLISLNGNSMQMFETGSWRKVVGEGFKDRVSKMGFSQDGKRMIALSRNTVQVYVLENENWRKLLPMEHEGEVTALFVSPDSKWMATKTAGRCDRYQGLVVRTTTRVWNLQSGEEVGWASHEDEDSCHKKPPLRRAASGGRTELALESVTWQEAIGVSTNPGDYTTDYLFSRDGEWKAILLAEKKVELLHINSTGNGVEIAHGNVNAVDFSPDGHWLATASDDGTVRLWPLWGEGIIKEACARLPHNLSVGDRVKYLGGSDFPDTCPGLPVPKEK
jgi:WD40 repeat protein